MEGSAYDLAACDGGKEALHGVSHEAEVRVKWNIRADDRLAIDHVGLFVGGVVVDDGVDDFSGRDGALNGVEG
jgi:hypothetical protein